MGLMERRLSDRVRGRRLVWLATRLTAAGSAVAAGVLAVGLAGQAPFSTTAAGNGAGAAKASSGTVSGSAATSSPHGSRSAFAAPATQPATTSRQTHTRSGGS